jgi:hypothetical protein
VLNPRPAACTQRWPVPERRAAQRPSSSLLVKPPTPRTGMHWHWQHCAAPMVRPGEAQHPCSHTSHQGRQATPSSRHTQRAGVAAALCCCLCSPSSTWATYRWDGKPHVWRTMTTLAGMLAAARSNTHTTCSQTIEAAMIIHAIGFRVQGPPLFSNPTNPPKSHSIPLNPTHTHLTWLQPGQTGVEGAGPRRGGDGGGGVSQCEAGGS